MKWASYGDLEWEQISRPASERVLAEAIEAENLAQITIGTYCSKTRFLRALQQDEIWFDVPHPEPDLKCFLTGDASVTWLRAKDGYHYRFVAAHPKYVEHCDGLQALAFSMPGFVERAQRRQSFRVNVPPSDAQLLLKWQHSGKSREAQGYLEDISASGAKVTLVMPLGQDDYLPNTGHAIFMQLQLRGDPIGIDGTIRRKFPTKCLIEHERGQERWELGIQFSGITLDIRDRLESYILTRTREMLERI
ncbi:flagellar brake protein [Acidithiobacillus caldus]|uniref:PilZ domain-containing protein n=1 Tax=Acidithiobacillus caldus TaxID=33059 RepID=A0A1E7YIK8_9PROT|nr:PilZ domain-containing protein [Acidithiobacillus caldus]OFC28465.1 hypothetical protein BAE27_15400 [Acidithiobacillus caldus]OFC37917.1 hypothetical protein BAE28_06560 [Acidithiobacillus caldus]OFC38961.1 hypothetical protein BAE29_08165 [Acidithiobacillus caldus]